MFKCINAEEFKYEIMKDLITIGIPVYNVEKYVEKMLLSALNQVYGNIEYLVVDDKGNDGSMDIIRSIVAKHPRGKDVRIIEHDKNSGAGVGRISVIENAKGEYIFFMDSDDEITENCIEILYNKMKVSPVDFIAASFVRKDREGHVLDTLAYADETIRGRYVIANKFYNTKNRHVPVWNRLYATSFLRENNIRSIPFNVLEDNIFTFQVVLNALSCHYVSDITYNWYDTPNSVMNQSKGNKISERNASDCIESINFKKNYIKKISDIETQETIYRYIIFQIKHYSTGIACSVLLTKKQKKEFINKLLKFPFPFSKIIKFRRKLFFYFMYIVYKSPFTLTCFKIIDFISK